MPKWPSHSGSPKDLLGFVCCIFWNDCKSFQKNLRQIFSTKFKQHFTGKVLLGGLHFYPTVPKTKKNLRDWSFRNSWTLDTGAGVAHSQCMAAFSLPFFCHHFVTIYPCWFWSGANFIHHKTQVCCTNISYDECFFRFLGKNQQIDLPIVRKGFAKAVISFPQQTWWNQTEALTANNILSNQKTAWRLLGWRTLYW